MARTRKERPYWVSWSPAIAGLFDLPPSTWTPPAQARVHKGRRHLTVVAQFRTPDGYTTTAKARIILTADGGGIQTAETLGMSFRFPELQGA